MQDMNNEEIKVCTSQIEARKARDEAMSSEAYQEASQVWFFDQKPKYVVQKM